MDTPRHFIDAIENTWTSEHLTGPDALRDEVEVVEAKLEQEAAVAAETMVAGGIEESRQLAEHLGAMNRAVETRLGGDWKELSLLLGSAIAGLALGYWFQKTLDRRIPWVGLAGVGVIAGGAVIRTRWSVRGSMMVGGAMLAGGSAVYVMTLPELAPAPAEAA